MNLFTRRTLVRAAIVLGAVVAAYTLLGFFVLPAVARSVAESQLTRRLHRRATIGRVRFNPYSLALTIEDFDLRDRDGGPFVAFGRLYVDLQAFSLLKGGIVVRDILLDSPVIAVSRDSAERYSFSDLVDEFAAPDKKPSGKPARYSLNNIRIENGSLDFTDRTKNATHTIRGLHVAVPFFSNLPYDVEQYVQPAFAAQINGTPLELKGRSKPFSESRETSLDLDFTDLSLPRYIEYLPMDLRFKVPSGLLDAKLALEFKQRVDHDPVLTVSGTVDVHDLTVKDLKDRPMAHLPLLEVKLGPSAVLERHLDIEEIRLDKPVVHCERGADGKINLADLIPVKHKVPEEHKSAAEKKAEEKEKRVEEKEKRAEERKEAEEKKEEEKKLAEEKREEEKKLAEEEKATGHKGHESKAAREHQKAHARSDREHEPPGFFLLDLAKLAIVDGTFHFEDLAAPAGPFKTTVTGITIDVKNFSTEPGKMAHVDSRLRTEAGESITHKGTFTLTPLRLDGHVEIKDVLLKKYAPYYAPHVLVDLDDGLVDLSTKFEVLAAEPGHASKAPRVHLSDLNSAVRQLRLHKRGEHQDLFSLELVEVKNAEIDLDKRSVVIGELTTRKARASLQRLANGTLNVSTLLPPPAAVSAVTADKAAPVVPPVEAPVSTVPSEPPPPWSFTLQKMSIDDYGIRIEDDVPTPNVVFTADSIAVTLDSFNLDKGNKANVSMRARVNRGGTIAMSGKVSIDPLTIEMKLDARALDFVPLQPYFTDKVNVLVTSGAFAARGSLTLAKTARGFDYAYHGGAGIDHLTTVDKASSEDLLRFDSLYLANVDVTSHPSAVHVGELSLSGFYSRLVLEADATLNVRNILVSSAPSTKGAAESEKPDSERADTEKSDTDKNPAEKFAADRSDSDKSEADKVVAPSASASLPVKVDVVTLQGGLIEYSDHYIKPNFSTTLHDVGGRITGLSSDESALADIDLKAKLESTAPLEITGKVNPLARQLALDLKVSFKDIELSPLSPYSGKYAGYTLSKGRLSLDLKYTIAHRKLEATNVVSIDQLTLGDKVDSKEATKLPLKLAVALLKDRDGLIRLALPISGSLDDPKFSVSRLVAEVILNVIEKAIIAPFALLGQLVGHGEELSYLEFPDGSATPDGPGEEKVKSLAKALGHRPALKLDITGHADPVKDKEGLRRTLYERKLKSAKLKELTRLGQTAAATLEEVTLDAGDRNRYLPLAYRDETFPKPRNAIGLLKDLPLDEQENLILTHIEVQEDDLRSLARARAEIIRDQLTKAGVDGERIYLVEAHTIAPEKTSKTAKLRDTRVDFAIK